jgi:hypothetical protein
MHFMGARSPIATAIVMQSSSVGFSDMLKIHRHAKQLDELLVAIEHRFNELEIERVERVQ